jgi:hypothetical protein
LNFIRFVIASQCLLGYIIGLLVYSCKTNARMYMRTGFLIVSYGVLFLCRFIVDLDAAILHLNNENLINFTKSVLITIFNAIWIALYIFVF